MSRNAFKIAGRYAGQFASRVQQGSLKPFLSRNSEDVLISGYFPFSEDGYGFGFGTGTPRSTIGYNNINRVRQTDTIKSISAYLDPTLATAFYFDVWRKDGLTYDTVHHIDISSDVTEVGLNQITFISPLSVNDGDWIGFSGIRSAAAGREVGTLNGSYGVVKYNEAYPSDNTDWDNEAELADRTLLVQAKGQSPLVVAIGDSIIAGHPAHYSYVENSNVNSPLNCITAQLTLLDSKYISQNMGIGGERTTQIAARFEADCVNLKPKIALINGVINDISSELVDKATTLTSYATMLDLCVANDIIPFVVGSTPWTGGTTVQMQDMDDRAADIKTLVESYSGAIYVIIDDTIGQFRSGGDVGNLWNYKAGHSDDNVHPNLTGYTAMASVINTEIKKKYRF